MKEQVNDRGTKWEHGNVVNLFSYIMGHRGDGNRGWGQIIYLFLQNARKGERMN